MVLLCAAAAMLETWKKERFVNARAAEAAKAVCGCKKKAAAALWGFCFLIGARPLMMDPQSLNSTSSSSTQSLFIAMQKQARALSHIKHPHLI
jgi:hypothetical protein